MQTSELSERVEATILGPVSSIMNWKTAYAVFFAGDLFNAVDVAVESGHVTLSGQVISGVDRESAEQTIRRLKGVVDVTNRIIASPTGPGVVLTGTTIN